MKQNNGNSSAKRIMFIRLFKKILLLSSLYAVDFLFEERILLRFIKSLIYYLHIYECRNK